MAAAAVQTSVRAGPPGQPDIQYGPDYGKYLARSKRRQEIERLDKSLPRGFPQELKSSLVWDGDSIQGEYDWTYELTIDDIVELKKALRHFKCKYTPA